MSIWGKIGGAAAGLALGGPLGALIGAVAGHFIVDREKGPPTPEQKRIVFTLGVIALSAKMAKADGVVTDDEVNAFREVFHVPEKEIGNVTRVFNFAKRDIRGFDAYAAQLKEIFFDSPDILEDVLDGLFHIAKADGVLHDREAAFLETVASIFGFGEEDYRRIRARHVADEPDPYLVLGVDRGDSSEDIRRRYRALVHENHPDRLIARGLPEEFVAIANDKLAAINAAYERIEKERRA